MRQILISAFLLAASGCGNVDTTTNTTATPTPTPAPDPEPTPTFDVFPTTVNIGVDDKGKMFSAPILITGGQGVTFSSAAKNIATVSGNDMLATVTGVRPGTTKLTLTSGSSTATVAVTVTRYLAADVAKGQTSFMQFKCSGCHPRDADTSPSGIADHTDDEVFLAISQGVNPEGGDILIGNAKHAFAADRGIVGFLRSRPAVGVPKKDD